MILDNIKTALKQEFQPDLVEIIDESHLHAGHAGFGVHSHLLIKISAAPFANLSRVERERAARAVVMNAAKQDIHALNFKFVS